jgi:hypothetical protein
MPLQIQNASTASTNYGQAAGMSPIYLSDQTKPNSGIIHLVQYDTIVVSLIDGSYHCIFNVSNQPTTNPPAHTSNSSQELTRNARSIFLVTEEKETPKPKDGSEPPKLYRNHVAKTTGAVAVDTAGTILWIHQ